MEGNDRKRQLRELKRVIKRDGSKHRRRAWKDNLRDDPENAHFCEEDLGGRVSKELNGLDRPADGT